MAQQPASSFSDRSTRFSKALRLGGALSLGPILVFACFTLLAAPSRVEADLPNAMTSLKEDDASISEDLSDDRNRGEFTPSDLARLHLGAGDTIAVPHLITNTNDNETQVQASPLTTISDRLMLVPGWFSSDEFHTRSIAWGDVDRDGDLDLAVGDYFNARTKVYRNVDGVLQTLPSWTSCGGNYANSIAWGDVNGDGYLDLAVGNGGTATSSSANLVYLNMGGILSDTAAWVSDDSDDTHCVAWGDVNGDGYLDLAVGNWGAPIKVYLNTNGVLTTTATYTLGSGADNTNSIAWGDVDGDGDLDLAVGNGNAPNKLFLNENRRLQTAPRWLSRDSDDTRSIAWGDMNGDGDLDLAESNWDAPNKVYLNVSDAFTTMLAITATWTSRDSQKTASIAWGDVDGDGDLDLATGEYEASNKVYLNLGSMLDEHLVWSSPDNNDTYGVAWADMDADGDLDLAAGAGGVPTKVYFNLTGVLHAQADEIPDLNHSTRTIAWGDIDGDGDLDLATGNHGAGTKVYTNIGGVLHAPTACQLGCGDDTSSIAWGDINSDGYLDLAVGNVYTYNKVYLNAGGMLTPIAAWHSDDCDSNHCDATLSTAWGDMDGDGDLDLAAGNGNAPNRVYLNVGGRLSTTATWSSVDCPGNPSDCGETHSIAWGDVDGDGDLDLAAGNHYAPDRVYLNVGGLLTTTAAWALEGNDRTNSIAWGDVDGDGDLDLAAGNLGAPNEVYFNVDGALQTQAGWTSNDSDYTSSIAWGDVDGDGDLDLAAGNRNWYNKVYLNVGGALQPQAAWVSNDRSFTNSIAWGDVDSDGDLDLAAGTNWESPNKVYLGNRPVHVPGLGEPQAVCLDLCGDQVLTPGVSDVDKPQAMRLDPGSDRILTYRHSWRALAPADYYAVPGIRSSGRIPITYTLFHPTSEPVRLVRAYYSLDGSLPRERSSWRAAAATGDTITTNLATSPYPAATIVNTHVYTWDVLRSGFMGQSDNVIVRIEALPSFKPLPNSAPGPFQRPYVSAQTYRFRVRGTQVRVVDAAGNGVPNAVVYRKYGDAPALPMGGAENPFHTNQLGYLQGRGTLSVGDGIVALAPIRHTDTFTLYHTSARPTLGGLEFQPVQANQSLVQTLTVSAANPLVLFNLDVALEWDARRDTAFLNKLQTDLRRTAEYLYDWSNGQVSLGDIRIHHDARRVAADPNRHNWQPWLDSHVRIYATNRLRPTAAQGGVVSDIVTDTANSRVVYEPGQVHMGAVWTRYGDTTELGEDWPHGLAHELAHYLLYLDDNYLGFDNESGPRGLIITLSTQDCPGAMTDPYSESQSEFHPTAGWLTTNCEQTLSHHSTGRSDWQTIIHQQFYPELHAPTESFADVFGGPNTFPLALPRIEFIDKTSGTTLEAPIFYLVDQSGASVQPGPAARAILFQGSWLTDLGRPVNDEVLARGAREGDRLCVFDLLAKQQGCINPSSAGSDRLRLQAAPDWQPDIIVRPVTSRTIEIRVGNVSGGRSLQARLYPLNQEGVPTQNMLRVGNEYVTTFNFPEPAEPSVEGYVYVQMIQPYQYGAVADYFMGGDPAMRRGHGAMRRGHGAMRRGHGAPVISSDGQVMIYGENLSFDPNQFFTLQAVAAPPNLPDYATLVGQAYRLTASPTAPDLSEASISFSYLGSEVPPLEEAWLKIYHYNPTSETWEALTTSRVFPYYNVVSARPVQPGSQRSDIYALMSSWEIALPNVGWNLLTYPLPRPPTRPVTLALSSIAGDYDHIYGYNGGWQVYAPTAPSYVNTLENLEFGHAYWITTTRAITLYLPGSWIPNPERPEDFSLPPATFYGEVLPGPGFTPQPGMPVQAWIGGSLCGQASTQQANGRIVYVIHVSAAGPTSPNCGAPGRSITFRVAYYTMAAAPSWNDSRLWLWSLAVTATRPTYLPLVRR